MDPYFRTPSSQDNPEVSVPQPSLNDLVSRPSLALSDSRIAPIYTGSRPTPSGPRFQVVPAPGQTQPPCQHLWNQALDDLGFRYMSGYSGHRPIPLEPSSRMDLVVLGCNLWSNHPCRHRLQVSSHVSKTQIYHADSRSRAALELDLPK